MTARHGLFAANGTTGVTSPQDGRLALSGMLSSEGVLSGMLVSAVSSGPNMKYSVSAGACATVRGSIAADGVFVWANDGPVTVDSGAPAPSSGTRWDLVYARHRNANDGASDANSDPEFGVQVGAAASVPTKPYVNLPPGALVLAECQVGTNIPDSTTAVITQAALMAAGRGIQTVWQLYFPTLTHADTGTVVSSTVNRARYAVMGRTVYVQGDITANAACTNAAVDLPFVSKERLLNCGTLGVFGAAVPADQTGIAYMAPDRARLVVVAYSQGFRDVAAGHIIRWNATYERV